MKTPSKNLTMLWPGAQGLSLDPDVILMMESAVDSANGQHMFILFCSAGRVLAIVRYVSAAQCNAASVVAAM